MNVKHVRGLAVAAALLAVTGAVGSASAQWGITSVGVAEYDTNETLLLLAGVSAGPGGRGLHPVVGVQAYHLSYDGGDDRTSVISIRPSVGVRNNFDGGSAQARIGYAFRNKDDVAIGTLVPDAGDGVVVAGQVDYWGTGSPLGAQAIASYDFGGESLWARGRLTTRLLRGAAEGSQLRVGAEAAVMSSENFDALQPGGVLEWHTGSGLILGAGAGVKLIEEGEDATYFRAEVVLPLRR